MFWVCFILIDRSLNSERIRGDVARGRANEVKQILSLRLTEIVLKINRFKVPLGFTSSERSRRVNAMNR